MKHPNKTVGLALALCALLAIPAASAPPTLGGSRPTSMAFSFTASGPQAHPLAELSSTPVDPEVESVCAPPRCHAFPFRVISPIKKAKSVEVSAQIRWTSPTARFWLKVMDVTRDPEILAECFTFFTSAGPSSTVKARAPLGRKLAIWVTVQQVVGASEVVKGVVRAPAKDVAPASPISGLDPTGLFLNPCQG
jgi:hypothetical protein